MTKVDDLDSASLNLFKWRAEFDHKNGKFYAVSGQTRDGTYIRMHSFLTGQKGTDHKDGDSLNNQRENLRVATASQNQCNRGPTQVNTSGYKYVVWTGSKYKPWQTRVGKDGKKYGKSHVTKEEAAIEGDKLALKLHGEFAYTNFPKENYIHSLSSSSDASSGGSSSSSHAQPSGIS